MTFASADGFEVEHLSDTEVQAPAALLERTVQSQSRYRVELIADVHSQGTNRREISQARTDGIAKIGDVDTPPVQPHVAIVEESDRAEAAPDGA